MSASTIQGEDIYNQFVKNCSDQFSPQVLQWLQPYIESLPVILNHQLNLLPTEFVLTECRYRFISYILRHAGEFIAEGKKLPVDTFYNLDLSYGIYILITQLQKELCSLEYERTNLELLLDFIPDGQELSARDFTEEMQNRIFKRQLSVADILNSNPEIIAALPLQVVYDIEDFCEDCENWIQKAS